MAWVTTPGFPSTASSAAIAVPSMFTAEMMAGSDIVLDRIHIRRKKDACPLIPVHLMDVMHDLRGCHALWGSEHGVLRLLLRERVPVPVVVVADIVVVEPRQGRGLVLRAEPFVVPVRHPLRPVRI